MRRFGLPLAHRYHNLRATCRRGALKLSCAEFKVLTTGSGAPPEMSRQREVGRVVVTRHRPPFHGPRTAAQMLANQLVHRSAYTPPLATVTTGGTSVP